MKKYILLLLLIPALCYGGIVEQVDMVLATQGLICPTCTGTTKFIWYFENTTVTTSTPCAGCSDGDTTATAVNSPALTTFGGYDVLHINALNERYEFAVSGDDLIEADNVKITFDIYIVAFPATPGNIVFLYNKDDANNYTKMYITNGGTVEVQYAGNGAASEDISTAASSGSWLSCEYQLKAGVGGNDHYLSCGTPTEEDDDLTARLQSDDTLRIGDYAGTVVGEFYLKNLVIDVCDKY